MNDRFFVEFSRENSEAAKFELLTVEKSSHSFTTAVLEDQFAIVEGRPDYIMDCSFVNYVSKILEQKESYHDFTDTYLPEGSFFTRVKDFDACHNANSEPEIGRIIKGDHTVTFKNPDFKVRAIHAGSWYLSVVVYEKDKKSMEARRAPLRPFFSPIAIHPKYARYLVNTTETKPKDTILDPFCGTGGILLEAGLMGRRIKGNDFSLNMVKGARLNLKYFNLKDYTILNRDIADLELDTSVDGIATDLPYGRNSNMKAESLRDLYRTAFAKFHELLKPGGVASIIISDTDLLVFADGLFESGKIVGVPQHRSLTRYFVHLKKLDT